MFIVNKKFIINPPDSPRGAGSLPQVSLLLRLRRWPRELSAAPGPAPPWCHTQGPPDGTRQSHY